MKSSLVVPCFNEENNVFPFYNEVEKYFNHKIDSYEVIFVNDGSNDHTLEKIKELYNSHNNIKMISFSRNFGKEAAILAGLEKSIGEYVTVIDGDLQQSPKYVLDMIDLLDNDDSYDCVAAYQDSREENLFFREVKKIFYKMFNTLTDIEILNEASDFRTFRREVVESVLSLPERCRFSKGIFSWVGYNTYLMPYHVDKRYSGESKWSFYKLFTYALDGIISFSNKLLIISSFIGLFLCLLSVIFGIYSLIIHTGGNVEILITLLLFLSGIQLFFMGVLGQYLGKTYIESKQRPVYIIKEYLE